VSHLAPSAFGTDAPAPFRVLIIDDEEMLTRSCSAILTGEGYDVHAEHTGEEGMAHVREHSPDLVLLDLVLPGLDGLGVLKEIRQIAPETRVVIITGFATVEGSVEAIGAGAWDYLPKPFTATQLRVLVGRAAHEMRAGAPRADAPNARGTPGLDDVLGTSEPARQVAAVLRQVAPTDAFILMTGKGGPHRERLARAVHAASPRAGQPFRALDCASVSGNLVEAELLGYVMDTFSGERRVVRGVLEAASGGTVFLDEVAALDAEMQARLLRAIRERRIRRVGDEADVPVDVRLVTATSLDPEQAVRDGRLSGELRHRLDVASVHLPPLLAGSSADAATLRR
jgi:DNA-binding NtrC family response regulator